MTVEVVILAAGQGKRMHSALPKVLHRLAGKTLLSHVLDTAHRLSLLPPIIIYGHHGKRLLDELAEANVRWVEQKEQLGTGHAAQQALSLIADESLVLVLYGDVPLISADTLQQFINMLPEKAMAVLTAHLPHPTGYGRIKRDDHHRIVSIVEEKDASEQERAIQEVNSGIYLIPAVYLKKWLPTLQNTNTQGEYYLTDIIACAVKENIAIHSMQAHTIEEILGVNDRAQLAHLERYYQQQQAQQLMRQGVTLCDPARLDVRGNVTVGRDVVIDVNVILEGDVTIGDECVIGPNTLLRDVVLGQRVVIKANSVLEGAVIADDGLIGPFARIRPGTMLAERVHIGNFVEIKQSEIAEGSKINHLSYIGDSKVGRGVNIGAGTITCNYDGALKHKTIIGDDAFIGSCTQLVAPVTVGEGATIGAGSTITRDAPPHRLTIARAPQQTISDWERPKKVEQESQK